MGSYYETDGVTQLPIEYGDPVRVFILLQKKPYINGNGVSYGSELWIPLGAPIKCKYYDYGLVEGIEENLSTKILFDYIKEKWSTSGRHKTLSKETLTFPDLVEDICTGCSKYSGMHPEYFSDTLGAMFVLEDIYQTMIKFNSIVAYRQIFPEDSKTFEYVPNSKAREMELKNWYQHFLLEFSKCKDEKDKFHTALDASAGTRYFYSGQGLYFFFQELRDCMEKLVPWEDPKVQELSAVLVEFLLFDDSMERARKLWIPQSGKGSQDSELEIYQSLNKATEKIILARNEKDLRENGPMLIDEEGYYPYMREHNARKNNASEKE